MFHCVKQYLDYVKLFLWSQPHFNILQVLVRYSSHRAHCSNEAYVLMNGTTKVAVLLLVCSLIVMTGTCELHQRAKMYSALCVHLDITNIL